MPIRVRLDRSGAGFLLAAGGIVLVYPTLGWTFGGPPGARSVTALLLGAAAALAGGALMGRGGLGWVLFLIGLRNLTFAAITARNEGGTGGHPDWWDATLASGVVALVAGLVLLQRSRPGDSSLRLRRE